MASPVLHTRFYSRPLILHRCALLWLSTLLLFLPHAASQPCSNQQCGNVTFGYPFSANPACPAFSSYFELLCQPGGAAGDVLYLNTSGSNRSVLQISSDSLIVNITDSRSILPDNCTASNFTGNVTTLEFPAYPGPFLISGDNKFGSFNCTLGLVLTPDTGSLAEFAVGGCDVVCPGNNSNPECDNRTCCVTSFPSDIRKTYYYVVSTFGDLNGSCGGFSTPFYKNYTDFESLFGLKLEWALPSKGNDTASITKEAKYACSQYSNITLVSAVPGYRCECLDGFQGDGYSHGRGCTDINECASSTLNDCIVGRTVCENSIGTHRCRCKSLLFVGDGTRNGSGCRLSPALRNAVGIIGGFLGSSVSVLVVIFIALYWRRRRRRHYFLLNGGLQLEAYIAGSIGRETTRLFSIEELQLATQNFSDKLKVGAGGFGTVFKGTLKDGRTVAIKRANRSGDERDNQQFLNEVVILTQINHRHIVRLLGCCLETATPLLVYEFVSNGTLSQHLQRGQDQKQYMGWRRRLQVAIQAAEALAYLHRAASPPILHRDVKTANILLDGNLEAKVADFGVSKLVPEGEEQVSTAVQGTIGYLDPEYFQTLQLTDKSDVYSMGVVLIELITGLKPVDNHDREARFANLALLFMERMREGRLAHILDSRLAAEGEETAEEAEALLASVLSVARLAHRCLALRGGERPSMSQVAEDLRVIQRDLQGVDAYEEAQPLLTKCGLQDGGDDLPEVGAVVACKSTFYVQSSTSSSSAATSLTIESFLPECACPR